MILGKIKISDSNIDRDKNKKTSTIIRYDVLVDTKEDGEFQPVKFTLDNVDELRLGSQLTRKNSSVLDLEDIN